LPERTATEKSLLQAAMIQPDWEGVKQHILGRLSRELAPDLAYHGVHHTRDDVLPAAERLATLSDLDSERSLLLRTAALFHDVGYLERYLDNEPIAVRIAQETLPRFAFSDRQIELIGEMILATRLPHSPNSFLQALICDADLDSLGRRDFLQTSHNLRRELAAHGEVLNLMEWYERQLGFLRNHTYFTPAARSLRNAGKHDNIQKLRRRLRRMP
jgi:uncharacterized protein